MAKVNITHVIPSAKRVYLFKITALGERLIHHHPSTMTITWIDAGNYRARACNGDGRYVGQPVDFEVKHDKDHWNIIVEP